uniref:Uncharacterized protein n=1 Tax=Meloidogyne enterolobii TaxID=390850 RepID=A0A6V7UL16_MELEN|nr:unnamed protein product [Meloidogyne enterolobii]
MPILNILSNLLFRKLLSSLWRCKLLQMPKWTSMLRTIILLPSKLDIVVRLFHAMEIVTIAQLDSFAIEGIIATFQLPLQLNLLQRNLQKSLNIK